MATNVNLLTGSLLTLFNNSSVISKPFSDYSGSLFFGPNQELTLRSSAPIKGRIRPQPTFMENKSFGTSFEYDKVYNIFVDFYTVRHVKDSTGLQDYELVNRYMQLIEDAVVTYPNNFGPVSIVEFGEEDAPALPDDNSNNVIGATKLLVFRERR
jgi:hypothetical protein